MARPTTRRSTAAVAAAALALVVGAEGPASAAAAGDRTTTHQAVSPFSAGTWGGTGTTLDHVRASIRANTAAAAGATGKGIGIALIDTGVVPVAGLAGTQVVNGPDLSLESQSSTLRYLDTYGHGTHMAGIMVGNDPATGFRGVAPDAKLTSIKVGTATGAVDPTQVIAALDWVVQHRNDDTANPIRVVDLAYGIPNNLSAARDALCTAVENASKAGVTVVVSAGNLGSGVSYITSPATDSYAITVGSVGMNGTDSPTDDTVSSFSAGKSSMLPNKMDVDVLAPGESIVSLRNPGSYADTNYPSARQGDTLFRGSGTSQASAVVAGAAADLLSKYPTLTPAQVKGILRFTGTQIGGAYSMLTEVDLTAALTTPHGTSTPIVAAPNTATLDTLRGTLRLQDGTTALSGDRTIWGPLSPGSWTTASAAGTAWNGGTWMGFRIAGDGWTGASWASRTWAPATWAGTNWAGQTWTDNGWSGRAWSGRAWSAGSWQGKYWASDSWASSSWS